MGREEFVGSLPLPLAQLWRRAHDTAAADRRREAARDIVEVAIRLRAHASLQRPLPDPSLAAAWKAARAADPYFATDIAASPGFAEIGSSLGLTRGTVADVLDRALKDIETVEAAALLAAAGDMLRHVDVLAGRRLVYARIGVCYELRGEAPRPIADPEREAGRAALSVERVALAGPGGAVDWDDVARFDPDTVEFYLRADGDWVCHATGRRRPAGGRVDTPTLRADASPGDRATRPRVEERVPERRRLGEFAVLSRIGEGGMGIVYRAWQPSLGRCVAVKCVRAGGDEKSLVRFDREIRALGRVEHPNLVKIFTSGSEGDQWYYAMELVEGADLERISRKLAESAPASEIGDLQWRTAISRATTEAQREETVLVEPPAGASIRPPSTARDRRAREHDGEGHVERSAEIVRQIAEAAHALHEAGLVHRDIKPGNVILDSSGTHATLMDLGLVRSIRDAGDGVTRTQQFVGTLRYASPEQLLGEDEVGREADVYSLGVTLYELLTLRPIFDATNSTPTPVVIERILNDEAVLPRRLNPRVPRDLQSICLKCLEKDPKRRYATAAELAEDVARWQSDEPIVAKHAGSALRIGRFVRRFANRRTWTYRLLLTAVAVGAGFAFLELGPAVRVVDRWFDARALRWIRGPSAGAWSERVAVIALDDEDRAALPAIARSEGVPDVSSEDPSTWRGLHGRLFEKLAIAPPAVVVSDFTFRDPKPGDERLVAGVDELLERGAYFVAGIRDFDSAGSPKVTPPLRERMSLAGLMFLGEWTDADVCFGSLLVANHARGPTPSLGLAAYALDRGRGHAPSFQWNRDANYVTVDYHGVPASTDGATPAKPAAERIFLLDGSGDSAAALSSTMNTDVADACYDAFALERPAVLAARTARYADVFAMDEAAIRARFGDRIVVLGDTCESHKDKRPFVDLDGTRSEFSCYGHAGEIDKLLRGERTRRAGFTLHFLTLAAAAVLAVAGMALWRSPRFAPRAGVVLAAMGAAAVGAVWIGATFFHVVLSPSQYVIVALVEVVGSAAIRRTSDTE